MLNFKKFLSLNEAQDIRGNANFWKWFGKSKVVDSKGNPLIVYHGTDQTFHQFGGGQDDADYFSPCPKIASEYSTGNSRSSEPIPNVVAAYLSIQHPLVINEEELTDMIGEPEDRDWTAMMNVVYDARKHGYDGIHLVQVYDNEDIEDQWLAFHPTQIKSAIGNNGNYNPHDPDITK